MYRRKYLVYKRCVLLANFSFGGLKWSSVYKYVVFNFKISALHYKLGVLAYISAILYCEYGNIDQNYNFVWF